MTKSEISTQITNYKNAISAEETQISDLKEKIRQYENAYGKLDKGKENLGGFCLTHKEKIRKTKDNYGKVPFINTYIKDMVGFLEGQDYKNAQARFEDAKKVLTNKKTAAQTKISELESTIKSQKSTVAGLQADYDAIVLKEKEAEEAAKAAKAAKKKAAVK